MKQSAFLIRIFACFALCFVLAAPALAADAAPDRAKLEAGLKQFGEETIKSMNRCLLPSEGKKEVLKNGGQWTARYKAVDPRTIRVRVEKSNTPNSPVTHIGYLSYCENEFICTAASKDAALKGPFSVQRTENLTELVKFMGGKWTY